MSRAWRAGCAGRVEHDGLVHLVYTWYKEGRLFWETQCNIQWSWPENHSRLAQPTTTHKAATCVRCLSLSFRSKKWRSR